MKEAWQQTRQTLHRWVHITMVGYGLVQMLCCLESQTVEDLCRHTPWRQGVPVTAGQIRKGLVRILGMLVFGSGGTVNAKYPNPQTGWKTGILHMNDVKPRNTHVNNEATNRVRAGKNGSNGSGSL